MRPALLGLLLLLAAPAAAEPPGAENPPTWLRLTDGTAAFPALAFHLAPGTGIHRSADDALRFTTSSVVRFSVLPDGGVIATSYVRVPLIAGEDGASRFVMTTAGSSAYTSNDVADGEMVAHIFNTTATAVAGDKLLSIRNAGVEKAHLDYAGTLRIEGNAYASAFFGIGLYASGEGIARYGLTVNGRNASYATTTLTGGEDLGHTFFTSANFGPADKVLQWGDSLGELGAGFGDGSMQFDGVLTSDGTGTSSFAGRVLAADGVDVNTTAAQPTCAVALRGLLWTVEGGAGVADKVEQCMKGTTDTYAWKTIATAL